MEDSLEQVLYNFNENRIMAIMLITPERIFEKELGQEVNSQYLSSLMFAAQQNGIEQRYIYFNRLLGDYQEYLNKEFFYKLAISSQEEVNQYLDIALDFLNE